MNNDVNFVETNPNVILEKLVKDYEDLTGEILYPGDERRLFLYNQAQIIVALKNGQNEGLKSNLLRYAKDDKLDALGEFTDSNRLKATFSKSKLKVTLKKVLDRDFLLLKNTIVTPDGVLFFKTYEDLIIKTNELTGIVEIIAIDTGSKYNGFLSGQIKNLVQPLDDVLSIENIETSNGGSDIEDNEKYRERIRLSPNALSTAGPEGAYEYHAKSTNSNIEDVYPFSPTPGVAKLIILLKNGEIPSQSILDDVLKNVSQRDKRPLTDKVEVGVPSIVNYDIDFTYYILKENLLDEAKIKDNIENAVKEYVLWQKSKLGRSLNPDYLRKLVLNTGANRLIINSPTFSVITKENIAKANNINIVYGGLD